MHMSESYLNRYLSGDYERVWAELIALGPAIREEPLAGDARAVAQEAMRRARHNVALIVPRLRELGYRFVCELPPRFAEGMSFNLIGPGQSAPLNVDIPPAIVEGLMKRMQDSVTQHLSAMGLITQQAEPPGNNSTAPADPVWRLPDDELRERVTELEAGFGPLPLSLSMWFDVVGELDLMGVHPKLSCYVERFPDDQQGPSGCPLFVGCFTAADDIEMFIEDGEEPPYALEIAPDECHKSNYSGGGAMAVHIPDPAIDAKLVSEDGWDDMYFLDYLRLCFRYGGFPGLHYDEEAKARAAAELAFLTDGLLPL
jgi:hypothetical protein